MALVDDEEIRERLLEERDEAERIAEALSAELDWIIESVLHTNNDDEHDPDGATNGYERAKTTALLQQARRHLIDIDQALERVFDGTYRRCDRCGRTIGARRHDALPTTTLCRSCAVAGAGR